MTTYPFGVTFTGTENNIIVNMMLNVVNPVMGLLIINVLSLNSCSLYSWNLECVTQYCFPTSNFLVPLQQTNTQSAFVEPFDY